MSTVPDLALESASWNLEPLVGDRGAEGVVALLDDAGERARAFAERYRGQGRRASTPPGWPRR